VGADGDLRRPRRDDDEGRPRPRGGREGRAQGTELKPESETPLPHRADLLVARSLDGDGVALGELITHPELLAPPRFATTIPALALEAKNVGLEIPETWHRKLLGSAVHGMLLKAQLDGVGKALDSAGIPWMPIKGMDLGYRLWPGPEARPTSDLDVLVPVGLLKEARTVLSAAGWTGVDESDLGESFLRDQGYNWKATSASGTLLELHFRLWSSTLSGWVEDLWEHSVEAPELGTSARRLSWPDAFLVCAVHLCQDPPPHKLIYFRELELIARRCGETGLNEVERSARRWGLSLQVALSAHYAARLWGNTSIERLNERLRSVLRFPERILFRRAAERGVDEATLGQIWIARLLSGRRTRFGWKVVLRRIWPHPAIRARNRESVPREVRTTSEP